jgi:predicted acyl esterase
VTNLSALLHRLLVIWGELKVTEHYEPMSELRDGMRIDWDVRITMSDGVSLAADVFRPDDEP